MTAHVWTGPHPKPYRHYRLNDQMTTPTGEKIVSVTSALGVLDKPALVAWAANQTADGAWRMVRRSGYQIPDAGWKLHSDMKRAGLDWRSNRDSAAERGTAVHKILEEYIDHGAIPAVATYPEEWRGYIRALAKWLMDTRAEFVVSEHIVGSVTHGFAGTLDTVALTDLPGRGRVMFDLKTSRGVYPSSHFRQGAAYALALAEMGGQPVDDFAVVRLGADGEYEVRWLSDGFSMEFCQRAFLHALTAFRDEQAFKAAERAAERESKK